MSQTTAINNQLPKVALIGRTNVGKSTLFNKLTGRDRAIVDKTPGTTRDRHYGQCLWLGQTFILVDTAGLDVSTEKRIDAEAIKHAELEARDSDLNLLMVDVKQGLLPQDKEYAQMLKKLNKPVILVINKVDSQRHMNLIHEFEKLGLGQAQPVSAVTGAGTGDLLDDILKQIKPKLKKVKLNPSLPEIRIAMVGKPNVGKSSLLNQVTGQEYAIVSDVPHTTRDSQDITIEYDYNDQKYALTFIDTAGISKKRKIASEIERLSVEQSLRNIKKADIVLLVLDANKDITVQDKNISREILENYKSLIIVVNKWDLVEDKDTKSDKKYIEYVHKSFPYLTWAPIVFISAKTGFKVSRLIKEIFEIYELQHKKIDYLELKKFLQTIIRHQSPRKTKGIKPPFIYSIKQYRTAPQTFKIITDQPKNIHFSYLRFIKNHLREQYGLWGAGIKLTTEKKKPEAEKSNFESRD